MTELDAAIKAWRTVVDAFDATGEPAVVTPEHFAQLSMVLDAAERLIEVPRLSK